MKKCPENKIMNPITNRCVNKNGELGKKILGEADSKNGLPKIGKLLLLKETKDDKLYFYSKSKDVEPGKGANEIILKPEYYKELAMIQNFRKVLSNFHVCPFKYEEYTYKTIEHVFQAKKIALVNEKEAFKFTIESGDPIGLGDGDIAQKNRKLIKLTQEQLQKWATLKDKVMYEAALAKYTQCPEAYKVLKATNNSQLWHIVSRSKPVRFIHLEKIRKEI